MYIIIIKIIDIYNDSVLLDSFNFDCDTDLNVDSCGRNKQGAFGLFMVWLFKWTGISVISGIQELAE